MPARLLCVFVVALAPVLGLGGAVTTLMLGPWHDTVAGLRYGDASDVRESVESGDRPEA